MLHKKQFGVPVACCFTPGPNTSINKTQSKSRSNYIFSQPAVWTLCESSLRFLSTLVEHDVVLRSRSTHQPPSLTSACSTAFQLATIVKHVCLSYCSVCQSVSNSVAILLWPLSRCLHLQSCCSQEAFCISHHSEQKKLMRLKTPGDQLFQSRGFQISPSGTNYHATVKVNITSFHCSGVWCEH